VTTENVLLADPFMADSNFHRSAIVICSDHQTGHVGLIFNKKLDVRLEELVEDFPVEDIPVYYGGPVATDTLQFIHNVGDLLENSIQIMPGIYWGGDFNSLKFLMENSIIKTENVRFFIGYSGWSEGQLKEEIKEGSWIVGDMDPNYIFKTPPERVWKDALANKGDTFAVIAELPDPEPYN